MRGEDRLKVTELALRHRVPTCMAVISFTILGIVSVGRIPREFLPHITWPYVSVVVHYENYRNLSTPEQTERRVTIPLENVLRTLPGVDTMTSRSSSNSAYVGLRLEEGADMHFISQQVRDKVNSVRPELPEDIGPVVIRTFRTEDAPILSMAMYHEEGGELGTAAERKLTSHLTRISGIAQVDIRRPTAPERVLVEVSEESLGTHHITMMQVLTSLSDANVEEDLGTLIEAGRSHQVRITCKLASPEEIEDLPVLGTSLRISDVSKVTYGTPPQKSRFRINGEEAWVVLVRKESGANVVDSVERAQAALNELETDPVFADSEFYVFFDQAEAIQAILSTLRNSGIFGGFFALLILFLFLKRVTTTAIVGISIPISIIATHNFMHLADVSLNVASMAGMMFAVGMLVDNAVVVIESIHRSREEGLDARKAAMHGTTQVSTAITAATLTTIIVFLPVVYVIKSNFGEFAKQAGLTIAFSLVCSLVLALTFIPILGAKFLGSGKEREYRMFRLMRKALNALESNLKRHKSLSLVLFLLLSLIVAVLSLQMQLGSPETLQENCPRLFENSDLPFYRLYLGEVWKRMRLGATTVGLAGLVLGSIHLIVSFQRFQTVYFRFIQMVLRRRALTLFVSFVIVILSLSLWKFIEREQYPGMVDTEVNARVSFPDHYTYEQTEETMLAMEKRFLPRLEAWGVEALMIHCVQGYGEIEFFLKDEDELTQSPKVIKKRIMDAFPEWPGIQLDVRRKEQGALGGDEVAVVLRGFDSEVLHDLAEDVRTRFESVQEIEEAWVGSEDPSQEIQVVVDKDAAHAHGVTDLRGLSQIVNAALSGQRVGEMRVGDQTVNIILSMNEEDKRSLETLKKLGIPNEEGEMIPLENIAAFPVREGPHLIARKDGRASINVTGRTAERGVKGLRQSILRRLEGLEIPEGYTWELGERFEKTDEEMQSIQLVLLFAVFLIFLVLAGQFESLIDPLAIMFTFPFASVGVTWALYLTDTTFNIVSGCGVVLLAGIVVNNAIVMVDYINGLRRKGLDKNDAILTGCRHRLRPVLMTALTTIIGLLPMALGSNDSRYAVYSSMGRSMEGGLVSATLLTLIVLPVVYSLLDDLKRFPGRCKRTASALGRFVRSRMRRQAR